ncbi:MAG: tetratricopeptide repeat protein [Actinomycetota bacterium]|nr:tetratricopeptide repeat protein [Actinomycetota bacterium]
MSAPSRDPPASGGESAIDLIHRAERLNDAAEYEAALEVLERAIELDPANVDAFVARGWALENLGPDHAEEAQAAYEKAVALDPRNPWGRQGLAQLLESRGDVEEARALYRSVVEDFADDPDPDVDLLEIVGWCRHRLGDHEAAAETFRAALAAEPDRASVRLDLALVLLHLGRPEGALTEVETALRSLEPTDPGHRRAVVQVALDDLQWALLSDRGIDSSPEAARAQAALEAVLATLPDR